MLTEQDIKVGLTYRSRRKGQSDRTVLYRDSRTVQYDSDSVKLGQHYPTVSIENFLRWAKEVSEDETG